MTWIAALIVAMVFVAQPGVAAVPEATNLTAQFVDAGAHADRLQVYEIAGVVIIRGRVTSRASAEELGRFAANLGYTRVANLVQIIENHDDEIARKVEVELANHRSLDGCQFQVRSDQGVVRVAGQVRHELQKDVTLQVLRQIDGVRGVKMDLKLF